MDPRRFDSLARSLAAGKTRRGFLGGLAALAAGLSGGRLAGAQVSQAQCGNVTCATDPGRCNAGCVCCVYRNSRGAVTNSRCRPPGTCSPGTEVGGTTTTTTVPPTTAPPVTSTTTTPMATTTTTTTTIPPCVTAGDCGDPCAVSCGGGVCTGTPALIEGAQCATGKVCVDGTCRGSGDCTTGSVCNGSVNCAGTGCRSAVCFRTVEDGFVCADASPPTFVRCAASSACLAGEICAAGTGTCVGSICVAVCGDAAAFGAAGAAD